MEEAQKELIRQEAAARRASLKGPSKAATQRNLAALAQQDARAKEWSAKGGRSTSLAKVQAVRLNGRLGGRPKKIK